MTEQMGSTTPEKPPSSTIPMGDPLENFQKTAEEFLAVADVTKAYGEPIQQGDRVIIPTAEVLAVLGYGVGFGSGNADQGPAQGGGGGGGGRTFSRPVAVIVASPEGVEVAPVFDLTKIGLAAITALGFMIATAYRMSRGRP